jgi:hypothetical protein
MKINARELFVDLALAAGGLSAAPDKFDDYVALLATSEQDAADPRRCRELAAMSSCALTIRGIWKRAGVAHPILLAPYRNQRAVSDLIEIAHDADALRRHDYEIARGDALVIGEGNNLHALLVTAHAVEAGEIWSIDGGQREGVFEAIEQKERHEINGALQRWLGGRLIAYVIDADAIAARWGIGDDAAAQPEEAAPPTSRSAV